MAALAEAHSKISALTKKFEEKDIEYRASIDKALKDAQFLERARVAHTTIETENKRLTDEVTRLTLGVSEQRGLNGSLLASLEAIEELNASLNTLLSDSRKKLDISEEQRQAAERTVGQQIFDFAQAQQSLITERERNQKLQRALHANEDKLSKLRELLKMKEVVIKYKTKII